MKKYILLAVLGISFSSFSYGQNYSVKNRWSTKLSVSFNRTNEHNDPFIELFSHPIQSRHNMRAECNYGVLDWLELGGYLGYMRYNNARYFFREPMYRIAFAPTFGINANVHLLPFLGAKKDCRWEWYLTAKYGGAYLINHVEFGTKGITFSSNGVGEEFDIYCLPNRYRHIFGVGMGGGVYFWNVFGLYAEVMGGQYSYFPEICRSDWTARVGIEFKFTKDKKKKLESKEGYDGITFH